MRNLYIIALTTLFVLPLFAQQETGEIVQEIIFDDYEPAGFSIQGNITVDMDIWDELGYDGTPGWELYIEGGSTSPFDSQIFRNLTYDSTGQTIWRLQYRIWANSSPFQITSSLRSVDSPYLGIYHHFLIPEGFEQQWILVDYAFGPASFYEASRVSLQFRLGNQQEQTLHFDDIRLFNSNVLASSSGFNITQDKEQNFFDGYIDPGNDEIPYNNSFELPVSNVITKGVSTERIKETEAPDGVQFLRASITNAGSTLSDSSIGLICQNDSSYTGAYRLNVSLRSNAAPLEIKGGLAGAVDLSTSKRSAPETVVLNDQDSWQRVSFLIPAGDFTGEHIYPFLEFGGQGEAIVDVDRVFIMRTDEEVTSVPGWEMF